MSLPEKYLSPYDPNEAEDRIYKTWEESGLFNPDECVARGYTSPEAEPFSIVLPPPNETGQLHIGHSAMLTIQDIMVRFHRMLGYKTLWVPGTDHAAIATESKVTNILGKQKIRKHDIGREAFLEEVRKFTDDSRSTILRQTRKMGASLDWSRQAYTLDEERSKAVFTAFERLYNLGLIYQGDRIVNWDPKGQTVISDDEIIREEETTKFYYFQYGPFEIGTARPETKFADKYVVVHPDDKRYSQYEHLQTFDIEWINGPITATLIKDPVADPEVGTGAMTITPWHSQVDFELAEKYDLDREQIIDQYGKLLPVAGEFAGMKITEARAKIVEKLQQKGLVARIEENYTHQLATAERTGGVVEPQIMKQWWIDTDKKFILEHSNLDGISSGQEVTIKELMQQVVRSKQIKIVPERFEKVYFHWIDNLRPWCISRQIWYGHRIPVWYKDKEKRISMTSPGDDWTQDPDTLDTWFSSGLWSFSTLGWPEKSADMDAYHPTSVLETGSDIIFFWVARMILMTTTLLGDIPFKNVYLHGLVRDEKGQKISKSLGNNIDPLDIISEYGTDSLRMAAIIGTAPGQDAKISPDKIRAYKKFANKLWNITRFVLENTTEADETTPPVLPEVYRAHLEELDNLTTDITEHLNTFRYYLAGEKLYHYTWHTFADGIIETSKEDLVANAEQSQAARYTLRLILKTCIKMLHPFMPFITEEIWKDLDSSNTLLMVTSWPDSLQTPSSGQD